MKLQVILVIMAVVILASCGGKNNTSTSSNNAASIQDASSVDEHPIAKKNIEQIDALVGQINKYLSSHEHYKASISTRVRDNTNSALLELQNQLQSFSQKIKESSYEVQGQTIENVDLNTEAIGSKIHTILDNWEHFRFGSEKCTKFCENFNKYKKSLINIKTSTEKDYVADAAINFNQISKNVIESLDGITVECFNPDSYLLDLIEPLQNTSRANINAMESMPCQNSLSALQGEQQILNEEFENFGAKSTTKKNFSSLEERIRLIQNSCFN